MRPDFEPSGNKNDEDIFSDEDIDKDKVDMETIMPTHVGSTRNNDEDDMTNDNTYAVSLQAMQQASRMWPDETQVDMGSKRKKVRHNFPNYNESELAKLKKETQRSQAQTEDFKVASDEKAPSFDKQGTYSEKSSHDFLARLRGDSTIKSERCNIDQKDIVRRVEQIIDDSKLLADRRRRRPQQFIRLLHGGPGTGKSHVIKILKENYSKES